MLAYQLRIRQRAVQLIAALHIMKRERKVRRRTMRQELARWNEKVEQKSYRPVAKQRTIARRITIWANQVSEQGVRVVHHSVKAAMNGQFGFGESLRILLNASKVANHLYSTLVYCMFWPKAMDLFLSIASFLALDMVADTKVACYVSKFDYYSRIKVAVVGPLAIAIVFVLCSILWATCSCSGETRKEHRTATMRSCAGSGTRSTRCCSSSTSSTPS